MLLPWVIRKMFGTSNPKSAKFIKMQNIGANNSDFPQKSSFSCEIPKKHISWYTYIITLNPYLWLQKRSQGDVCISVTAAVNIWSSTGSQRQTSSWNPIKLTRCSKIGMGIGPNGPKDPLGNWCFLMFFFSQIEVIWVVPRNVSAKKKR